MDANYDFLVHVKSCWILVQKILCIYMTVACYSD